jgi:predicted O-methyltransferase YrrM
MNVRAHVRCGLTRLVQDERLPMRLRHLTARALGQRPWIAPPSASFNSHLVARNQWYGPALAGASTFVPAVVGAGPVRDALKVLDRLSPDSYLEFVRGFYTEGLARFGDGWRYADISTVLLGLAGALRPSSYLEIGVRRGRSIAMVASKAPNCRVIACDLFVEDYAGMPNPGADLVRSELRRIGFSGPLEFVIGDSARVLPRYLADHPDDYFDLVTVDGDHSMFGAKADLVNVMPRVRIGGALVFDDIANPTFPVLRRVWDGIVVADRRFSAWTFDEVGFGVGFAIRKA